MQHGIEEQRARYQQPLPVIPRSVRGAFRNFKWATLALAYLVYFGLPWVPFSRTIGPNQAISFDLAARQFYVFGLVIYPQDIFVLALFLVVAAVLLFFVTGLVGRAFCGYFCFQTLWTDVFIAVERFIQGERPARIRLYKQPWTGEKVAKLAATHLVWLSVAFATGLTFVLYFGDAHVLVARFFRGEAPFAAYATTFILTATTYAAAGLAREQICAYMCPYGRFQSVMYDRETLTVHFDPKRGDRDRGRAAPRTGARTHGERVAAGIGDCIDCGLCVQVCPTGIDIRNGLQSNCISCGLCVDACNSIMDSMSYPRGLIRYDSEANLSSAAPIQPKLDFMRFKVLGYGAALLLAIGALSYNLFARPTHVETVQQVRQPLFVVMSDGSIRNRYMIRIINKGTSDQTFDVGAVGLPSGALEVGGFQRVTVRAGKAVTVQASVRLSPADAARIHDFKFSITPTQSSQPSLKAANFSYDPHDAG